MGGASGPEPEGEKGRPVGGVIDELNAAIGHVIAMGVSKKTKSLLMEIQNELFNLGAELSFSSKPTNEVPRLDPKQVSKLEDFINETNEILGPLANFFIPGGCLAASQLHVARTICRRAERRLVSLSNQESINSDAITFLNRLSDALFVAARLENRERKLDEPLWTKRT